jgi:ATP-dependent Lhr-like helicase
MTPEEIKASLPRTWHPFFARFGRFTAIQEMTIPLILEGENVVVISPAASGKTEAVVAPVLENILAQGSIKGLQVLYISPTRALVNDLFRRLETPIGYLNLDLGRKTGDRPKIDPNRLPAVLLTTPESFDSLLGRHPRIFDTLSYVILDEIHLLDNTPRGDQTRILLNRLRKINDRLRYCALSATIEDLKIGARYFDSPRVCCLPSPREIDYELMPARRFVDDLFQLLILGGHKKVLIFFNARSFAEGFSQKMNRPPFEDRILVHHASLPKPRREEVERAMNQSDRAILLATSTLELGIDIGNIDLIVLYRPPYNISSLLQRIGRGNRRSGRLAALGVYVNEWEKNLFSAFFACAREGRLFEKEYRPSLSVIPQQAYSYLFQRRRIGTTLNILQQTLAPVYSESEVRGVFQKFIDEGTVREVRPDIYHLTSRLEDRIEYGKIHSNIAEKSFGEYDVFDVNQGNRIGRIYYLYDQFILGGRCWQKVQVLESEKKVFARFIRNGPSFAKVFEGKGAGNYHYRLAPVLKDRFVPGLKPEEMPFYYDGSGIHIIHLLGSLYGFLIADSLTFEGIDALDLEGKILTLSRFQLPDDRFPIPKPESIQKIVSENIPRLEDALGSGAFLYDLPVEFQVIDHLRNLDVEGFLGFLATQRMVDIGAEKFQAAAKQISG